jgi:hypothetical protein
MPVMEPHRKVLLNQMDKIKYHTMVNLLQNKQIRSCGIIVQELNAPKKCTNYYLVQQREDATVILMCLFHPRAETTLSFQYLMTWYWTNFPIALCYAAEYNHRSHWFFAHEICNKYQLHIQNSDNN